MKATLTKLICGLALLGAVASASAGADYETYNLYWSGSTFGNSAQATATITFNVTAIEALGGNVLFKPIADYVSSLSMVVSGATSGNGTFSLTDYLGIDIWPFAGQSWTTTLTGNGVDFSLFASGGGAPDGSAAFTLTTAGGGDRMLLSAVPEPSEWAAISFGLLGIVWVVKRRFMPARA